MQASAENATSMIRRFPRVMLICVLSCWAIVALLSVMLPSGFAGDDFLEFGTYWLAALFAGGAVVRAILREDGAGRVFWAVAGAALLLRFVGNASRAGFEIFDLAPPVLAPHDVAYGISYLLLFCALLWLVGKTTTRIALVAALDSMAVMVSVGLVLWYFFVDPATGEAGLDGWRTILVARSGPVLDVGLLCMGLVVLATDRRPPYAALLVTALAALLLADCLYLGLGFAGTYEPGGWPGLTWALGVVFLGLAAVKAEPSFSFVRQLGIRPRTVLAFWFSPLSPAMHLALLLVWGTFYPPIPSYVLWVGATLVLYFAFRISMASYVNRTLQSEAERLAVRREHGRISEELHDTLKQEVGSIPLMLAAYRNAREEGESGGAEEILDRATQTAREASYRVSRPVYELRASGGFDVSSVLLVDELLRDIQETFAVRVHEDIRASLDGFSSEEIVALYRVASEALWNAAKHSGAKNVSVETREAGSIFLMDVRDDGRGFCADDPPSGLGLSLMRSKAEEAGGRLDVISRPGSGTTIQLRFHRA